MSNTALVPVSKALVSTGKKKVRTELPPSPPHVDVAVVTEEEHRHEEQLKPKVEGPREYLRNAPNIKPPLTQGVSVSCETMLGFLAAIESIIPQNTGSPLLEAAKVWFEESANPRLFIEAGTPGVWTAVALEATLVGDAGFSMVVPVRRAKNVLKALRAEQELVTIGADQEGVCIGPHTIPFGGHLTEFPGQPTINQWVARAAMPAFYFGDICSRVLPARSEDLFDLSLQRVLLDFEYCEIDGEECILASVVATDGERRFHIMRLPHMRIQMGEGRQRLPPTTTVSAGFFKYLREIVDGKVVGIELSNDQVVAKGPDFIAVAMVSAGASEQLGDLVKWREYDVSHPGYWLVDQEKLMAAVEAGEGDEVTLRMDGLRERLSVVAVGERSRYQQDVEAQCINGPPIANVVVNRLHLVAAINCCNSGLIRIEVAHRDQDQKSLPIVIRGEDEQFKAVLQPQT